MQLLPCSVCILAAVGKYDLLLKDLKCCLFVCLFVCIRHEQAQEKILLKLANSLDT